MSIIPVLQNDYPEQTGWDFESLFLLLEVEGGGSDGGGASKAEEKKGGADQEGHQVPE